MQKLQDATKRSSAEAKCCEIQRFQKSVLWDQVRRTPSLAGKSFSKNQPKISLDQTKPVLLQCKWWSCSLVNFPKFSHSNLLCDLHWLPLAARISFKMVVLALKDANGTAPIYLQTLVRPHVPAWELHSSISAGQLVPPSQRANKAHGMKSRLFSVWHLSGGTNSWPMSGQRNHYPSSAKDSIHICSDFT